VTGSGLARYWARFLLLIIIIAPALSIHAGAQQIAVAPSRLAFGNVIVGNGQTRVLHVTNKGTRELVFSGVHVSGRGFAVSGLNSGVRLAPGQSARLDVTFTPSAVGADRGSVSISTQVWGYHKWKASSTVALSGSGIPRAKEEGMIVPSPAILSFGSLTAGGSKTLTETLTNNGKTSVTVSKASVSNRAFTLSGLVLPVSLNAGHSLTFSVAFAPTISGTSSGTLSVNSNASNPQLHIALSGSETAVGQFSVAPATLNFGSVRAGSRASLKGILSATSSSVTVSSITTTSAEFAVSGISMPLTVPAGQSVPFTVTFSPQSSGAAAARLAFLSNAGNSLATESLSGSGVATVPHSVTLSWAASSSAGVAGYNVYRSTVSGRSYARITSSPDGNLSYTDSTVSAGQSYFYVVTAVDRTGAESTYSNQAQAVVPTP
jgi:hypothetical protein